MLIRELLLDDGRSPYAEWFATLDAVAAAKVTVAVLRMEQGNLSAVKWFHGIGECRIDWGPGLRIYLSRESLSLILLLGGGTKRWQQTVAATGYRPREGSMEELSPENEEVNMVLTKDFRTTVVARVQSDPAYAKALLDEALTLLLDGDAATARLVLRDLVNATIGFSHLAADLGKSSKSVHRMLSRTGNPTIGNFAAIVVALKRWLGVEVHAVVSSPHAAAEPRRRYRLPREWPSAGGKESR